MPDNTETRKGRMHWALLFDQVPSMYMSDDRAVLVLQDLAELSGLPGEADDKL